MLLNRQLPTFSGVPAALAAGQTGITVISKLNLGERVHAIWLRFSTGDALSNLGLGTLTAQTLVAGIRLKINGKTIREFTCLPPVMARWFPPSSSPATRLKSGRTWTGSKTTQSSSRRR